MGMHIRDSSGPKAKAQKGLEVAQSLTQPQIHQLREDALGTGISTVLSHHHLTGPPHRHVEIRPYHKGNRDILSNTFVGFKIFFFVVVGVPRGSVC